MVSDFLQSFDIAIEHNKEVEPLLNRAQVNIHQSEDADDNSVYYISPVLFNHSPLSAITLLFPCHPGKPQSSGRVEPFPEDS